eukprot:s491_g29.t1
MGVIRGLAFLHLQLLRAVACTEVFRFGEEMLLLQGIEDSFYVVQTSCIYHYLPTRGRDLEPMEAEIILNGGDSCIAGRWTKGPMSRGSTQR